MPVELNNDGQNWLIWTYSQDMKRIVELGRVYNIHADGLIVVITAQFSACIGDGSRVRTILAIVTGNSKKLFSTIIVNFQYFFHFFIWVLVAICFAVSKKSGQWTVDCGLRIRDRGLGIKHGQGRKWGLRFFLFIYFRKLGLLFPSLCNGLVASRPLWIYHRVKATRGSNSLTSPMSI